MNPTISESCSIVPLRQIEHPHGWSWRNDLSNPSQIFTQPAFRPELGAVFVGIEQNGKSIGIWLPRDAMEWFIAGMRRAANVPD